MVKKVSPKVSPLHGSNELNIPRNYKLTWQPGASGRGGRWRKKYKGKSYYFDGGRGKIDRETYDAALSEWERLKLKINTAAPKQHQAEYE